MAKIVSVGAGLQDIYLIDHDDLTATTTATARGRRDIYGNMVVGSKVDIDRIFFEVGGGGVNSAISFARHGHTATFIGNLAHDPAGEAILQKLQHEGVNTDYVKFLDHKTTGTSVVLLDSKSGERTILTCRGASEQFSNFSEQDLAAIQPDWLYVTTLRGDFESLTRFFRAAQALGAKIMFNPGVKELANLPALSDLLRYVEILNVNQAEATQIAQNHAASKAAPTLVELLEQLRPCAKTVIITAGMTGGIATNGTETYRFGLYENSKVKDATGAGDAFGAGFLAHLAAGHSFREALTFASANSTAVVAAIGANRGILTGTAKLHAMPMQALSEGDVHVKV